MKYLRAAYKYYCKAEMVLCCIGFMVLIALVFLSAILRMFRLSMAWNIDMAMLLLAWTAFLGADMAFRNDQLLGVDLFTRNLPKKIQLIIEIVLFIIMMVALVLIVYYGIRLALLEKVRKYQSIPIPYHIVTVSLLVASASMAFSMVIKIKNRVLQLLGKIPNSQPA